MARRKPICSHANRHANGRNRARALVVEALGDRTMLSASPLGMPGWGDGPLGSHDDAGGPHPFGDQASRPFAAPGDYGSPSAGKGSNLPAQFAANLDLGSAAYRPNVNDAGPGGPRPGMHGDAGPGGFGRMLDDAGYRPVMQTTIIVITFSPIGNNFGYDTQHQSLNSDNLGSLPSATPQSVAAPIPPYSPPPSKPFADLSSDRSPPAGGLGNALLANLSKAAVALGETVGTVARFTAPPAAHSQPSEPEISGRAEIATSLAAKPNVQGLSIAPGSGRTLDGTSPGPLSSDGSPTDNGARRSDRMDADGDYADGGVVELLAPRGKRALAPTPDKLHDWLAGPKRKLPQEAARDFVWEEVGKFFERAGDLVRQVVVAGTPATARMPKSAVASAFDDGGSIELATGVAAQQPAAAPRGPIAGLGQVEVTIQSGVALFQAFELEASTQQPVAERSGEPAKAAERVPTRDEKAAAADELEAAKRSAATLGLGLMLAVPTALGGRDETDGSDAERRTAIRRDRLGRRFA